MIFSNIYSKRIKFKFEFSLLRNISSLNLFKFKFFKFLIDYNFQLTVVLTDPSISKKIKKASIVTQTINEPSQPYLLALLIALNN